MSSGVGLHENCQQEFNNIKSKKRYRYVLFALSKDFTQVVVAKTAPPEATYDDFLNDLPEEGCRWAVFDLNFEKDDGGKREKLVFFSWAPDTAKVKEKMVFASTKSAVKTAFQGIASEIQATEMSEVTKEIVLEKASRGN